MYVGADPDSLFISNSRNAISWLMIFTCSILYISAHKRSMPISIIPSLLTLICCFWAVGRSGIVSGLLLFIGSILLGIGERRNKIYLAMLFVASCFGYLYLSTSIEFEIKDIILTSRFAEEGIVSLGRAEIADYYIKSLDAWSFFFGKSLHDSSFMASWGFDLHNSFLVLHSMTGFISIIVIFLVLLSVVKSLKYNLLYSLLLLVICVRAYMDSLLFFGVFDFIIYYLIIECLSPSIKAHVRIVEKRCLNSNHSCKLVSSKFMSFGQ
jgi:hypothetical protein